MRALDVVNHWGTVIVLLWDSSLGAKACTHSCTPTLFDNSMCVWVSMCACMYVCACVCVCVCMCVYEWGEKWGEGRCTCCADINRLYHDYIMHACMHTCTYTPVYWRVSSVCPPSPQTPSSLQSPGHSQDSTGTGSCQLKDEWTRERERERERKRERERYTYTCMYVMYV